MNPAQTVCNYALLQFLPYPDTGEFVNVGVLMACQQPCLLHFHAEKRMTERVKVMFPFQHEQTFANAMAALDTDMKRATSSVRDPKTCQMVFGEIVRRRESMFRFGEVRTILTDDPSNLMDKLLALYVRMEKPKQPKRKPVTV